MALKIKESTSRRPDEEDGPPAERELLPTAPSAALEEHRRSAGVQARRKRVLARMKTRN
jgi:hypothetical protein